MRALCVAALVVALAGCSAQDGGAGPEPGEGPSSGPASGVPGLDLGASLLDDQLVLPESRQYRVALNQEEGAASEGLPPDHELAGDVVASLYLVVSDCDALVQGNRSVAAPFAWAVVLHFLSPMGNQSSDQDVFLRELFMPDPVLVQRLAEFGFPARDGQVAVARDGPTRVLSVVSDGVRYEARLPDDPQGPDGVDRTQRQYGRGGSDTRLFWMQQDVHQTLAWGVAMPTQVEAEGGYLGTALPGGSQPGLTASGVEAVSITFGERLL